MTIHYEIERRTKDDQTDIIEVDLLGDITLEDDSYSDEYGLVKKQPYHTLDQVQWMEGDFSEEENAIIEKHVTENFPAIEKMFINHYNKKYA